MADRQKEQKRAWLQAKFNKATTISEIAGIHKWGIRQKGLAGETESMYREAARRIVESEDAEKQANAI